MSTWALVVMVLLVLLAVGIVLVAMRRGDRTATPDTPAEPAPRPAGRTVADLVRARSVGAVAAEPLPAEPAAPVAEDPAAAEHAPVAPAGSPAEDRPEEPPAERRVVTEEVDAGPVGPPWTRGFVDGVPVEAPPRTRPQRRSSVDPALVARVTSVAPPAPARDDRPMARGIVSPAVAEAVARAEASRRQTGPEAPTDGTTVPSPRAGVGQRPVLAVVRGGADDGRDVRRLRPVPPMAAVATGGAAASLAEPVPVEREVEEVEGRPAVQAEERPVEVAAERAEAAEEPVEVAEDAETVADPAEERVEVAEERAEAVEVPHEQADEQAEVVDEQVHEPVAEAPAGPVVQEAAPEPADETAVAERPADEPPAEESVVEDAVVEDAAVDEIPVEDAAAEESTDAEPPAALPSAAAEPPTSPDAVIDTPAAEAPPGPVTLGLVSPTTSTPEPAPQPTGTTIDAAAGPASSLDEARAAEHAAVDLALLRTLGFADPNPRPGAAPVVDLAVVHEDEEPLVPGQAVPVRFLVVQRDRLPVAEAAVTLLDPRGRETASASADVAGRGEITAPRPGGYVLVAAADGHQPGVVALTVPNTEHAVAEVEVQLVRSSTVAGSVRDAGGSGLAGAAVSLLQDGELVATTISAADGAYRFGELAAGDYTVAVVAEGREPRALPVRVGEEADATQDVVLAGPVAQSAGAAER
ncbi:hypothetical protein GCM10023215_66560 [Pseudonocardia yuanmonensis]|uniref:Alpha-amylase n=1 Tax=Pseudonocardia yuanmonensis TaxID=1095914 RepID=A0ABP8XVM8_9PSEU